jgi:hypothetical protein
MSIDPGRFEAIIDCIHDEGDYKIKLRTYDENEESEDSNIIIARFRRQDSKTIYRTQSDQIVDNINNQITLRQTQSQENLIISPIPIIMNKQIEVHQSISSGGFPLLTQQQTTPDKKFEEHFSSNSSHSNHTNSSNHKSPK